MGSFGEVRCVTLPALPSVVFSSVRSFAAVPTTPRLSLVVALVLLAAVDPVGRVEWAVAPSEAAALPVEREVRRAVVPALLVEREALRVVMGALEAAPEVQMDPADRAGLEVTLFELPGP